MSTSENTEGYPLIIDNGHVINFLDRSTHENIGHVYKEYFAIMPDDDILKHSSALIIDAFYCYKGRQQFDVVE